MSPEDAPVEMQGLCKRLRLLWKMKTGITFTLSDVLFGKTCLEKQDGFPRPFLPDGSPQCVRFAYNRASLQSFLLLERLLTRGHGDGPRVALPGIGPGEAVESRKAA